MILLNQITLMRGQQILLENSSLMLHDGQRTGVIGRNGSGKTSLFRAISGEIPLEHGEIKLPNGLRMSTMSQETPGSKRCALDFVIDAHIEFRRLEKELAAAEERGDNTGLAHLHSELETIDGYDIKHRAEQLLAGLGFENEDFVRSVGEFSGGWRVRLNLAAALMCPSDLLMLDEPTNHLDLEATVWLEQWLQRYQGTLLLISHDRTFLDSVIDNVVSFDGGRLDSYKGNYSAFEKQRAEKMALQQALFEKQQRRKAQIEDFVRRFRAKATKAKQAQSRLKELTRMQDIAPAHIDSPFHFQFPELDHLPAFLMQLESISIGFDFPLAENIKLGIRSDSRIGLLGFNGSGKSTLLKVLAGQLEPLGGELVKAKKLRIGYFAQHQVDELDQQATPIELIRKVDELEKSGGSPLAFDGSEQAIKNFLGGFDFRGARVDEPITHFSGGEKARLALAKVVRQKPNLLLMDEPTNHLDLEMCHALTLALQEYQGALIIVSHDRHLLANTVDEFYSIHRGKFSEFKGSLLDYEAWLKSTARSEKSSNKESKGEAKVDKREQRQLAAAKRQEQAPLRKKEKQLENSMEKFQSELDNIEFKLADESLYEEARKADLTDLLQKQGQLKSELVQAEQQWFEIQDKLAGN